MRNFPGVRLAGVMLAACVALGAGMSAQADPTDNPVVVELFTSQGCSSCPPADELLATLGERDDVIPLAFHVDYWDYIGWKDHFASPRFTKRQKGYARAGGWKMIYTPQIIVNGMEDVVGSHPDEVAALVRQHEAAPAVAKVSLVRQGDRVQIRAEGVRMSTPGDIHVLRYAPSQEVTIKRGENAGKTVWYTHIVREWDVVARWDGTGVFEGEVPVPANEPVVVLLQAPKYGPILAAARLR